MLKITVIILASIISAVILQDVNQPLNQDESCARKGTPAVEKQVDPQIISSPPQSLAQEIILYEPKENDPKEHEPKEYDRKVYEPIIYEPKPEKYDIPKHYSNRRKNYPKPTLQPTSDEIVEKVLRHATDKATSKDCPKDLQLLDTRRSSRDEATGEPGANNDELDDPILRADVRLVNDNNKRLLMNNPRVCYACSTATNPTCWEPNRRTTIKYCNKDHALCITKKFGEGPTLTVIRDCANSCDDSPLPGLQPKYKSCKVCHSDLCNSAFSIKSYKLLYVLLLFTALKFTF